MKRIAVFDIKEWNRANEHLAKYPPEQVAIMDNHIAINYDDQTYPDAYKAEEIRALILSNTKEAMTTNISIKVALRHLETVKGELANAEKELEQLEATTINEADKKVAKDLQKDKKKKVDARRFGIEKMKESVKSQEDTIAGLKGSVGNFETKNEVLNEELALLKL